MEILLKQKWTGNIRELRNLIERLVIFVNNDIIDLKHIRMLRELQNIEKNLESDLTLRNARMKFERDYIFSKLVAHDWDIPQTAQNLGIARTALYRKMKLLGIEQPR